MEDMREVLPHFKYVEHSSHLLKKAWLVSKIAAETKLKVEKEKQATNFESLTKRTGNIRYKSLKRNGQADGQVSQIQQSYIAL